MKKKLVHRAKAHKTTRTASHKDPESYLVVVRSWMVVVAFAVMLGVGAIVGSFFNEKLNESTGTVAGAQSAR